MHDDDPFVRPSIVRPSGGKGGRAGKRGPGGPGIAGVRRTVIILLAALLVVLFLGPAAARRYTDWLWFREIGFERVFLLKIIAQWTLGFAAGLSALAILYVNARAALKGIEIDEVTAIERARPGTGIRPDLIVRGTRAVVIPAVALLSVLLAAVAASEWRTLVQFFYRTPFGVTDPVFGRDVAYYVFTVPMLSSGLGYLWLALVFSLLFIVVPVYVARGQIRMRLGRLRVEPGAGLHIATLVAALLVVFGLRLLFVAVPSLLNARHLPLYGASYTDLAVRLPVLRILGFLAFAAAVPVLWGARKGRLARSAGLALGGYAALAFLLLGPVPLLFQRLVVQPNELARETPQIARHIAATRQAWGIEGVERRELDAEQRLTTADIAANQATIANVRLWDREPLLQTFGQIQAIRTYYDFVSVDDDRYRIDGELRQVLLSAREMNTASLPTRTFINEHLTFTHGMGITLGPSNQVTGEGLPVLWIKDLPPQSTIPIRVTRPQIYFGEQSNEFVLAPSRQREFDYPAGERGGEAQGEGTAETANYFTYDGDAGVPVASFTRRLLFALRFGSLNILLSGDLTPATRILYHRDILDRAQRALPFLRFDADPYLVVTDDGRLMWMLDAYTVTDRFPYSQPLVDGTNYMRNSVKVTVDAYTGGVRAYLADPADPMIRTLSRIYPGLLRPLEEMPADLRAHIRYPEDLFRAQTALYATFHMTDPETFYHREDQWEVPASRQGGGREAFMRHIVMRLPGERAPEFILMRPFTPRQKDNLAAWMVARNDGAHYGKLVAYRFPRQSLVFGPTQIVNRINQDTEVARQISLWDQRGSEVIRGELLVIPIEQSLIYVQPLYLRAQGGRIPELKRVIVAHESQVAMEESLEAGLRRLFGGRAITDGPAVAATPSPAAAAQPSADTSAAGFAELLRQATQHYDRARAAQRADDWATYGAEMRRLGEILRRLEAGRQ